MSSGGFFNENELQQLIMIYRNNIEQLRENHDNLLSMMVVVVNHFGGEVQIPYSELEGITEGTPFNIKMTPDETEENMIITVERIEDGGDDEETDEEAPNISSLFGGPDNGSGPGGGPKFHA